MSDKTGIEWTDATWNPLRGCSRVSEGCRNCYAERVAARFGEPGQPYEGLTRNGRWTGDVRLVPEALALPLKWARPRRIFVNSMSDLFHESVSFETIAAIFGVMAAARSHTFQVLTKRPERAVEWFRWYEGDSGAGASALAAVYAARDVGADIGWPMHRGGFDLFEPPWPLPNVWLGVSVEDQASANKRVPLLLQCPAAVRWVSAEPMLGPVDLRAHVAPRWDCGGCVVGPVDGTESYDDNAIPRCPVCDFAMGGLATPMIHWVVAGGESWPGARPMHPAWARSLRDQCRAAGVPFLFKQWGEWLPVGQMTDDTWSRLDARDANLVDGTHFPWGPHPAPGVYCVGKRAAGRTLDGSLHDEYPT